MVDLDSRGLLCTCRGCYLLFTDRGRTSATAPCPSATCRSRASASARRSGTALDIPVGLAFFFASSVSGRTVAFYPGPAGATESELPLGAWEAVAAANPQLDTLPPDIEAC